MATLNTYLEQTVRFIRDPRMGNENWADLIKYINRARKYVAARTQCIRRLTPVSGSIIGWNITSGGSGYSSSPTLTVSAPDFPSGRLPFPNGSQATASAIVQAGVIIGIDSQYGGAGYFQPQLTITDTTGTGAAATPIMSYINQLNLGQEVYPFSSVDLSVFPGVSGVYMIKSVSVIYANYRYSLPCYSFSTYQAMIRQYPFQYQYVPTFFAQYGQGTDGSFFAYPLPSQPYQWEWDCFCLPTDLATDLDTEAIPDPWTETVPYFAAHLAYLELQNFNYAKGYMDLFEKMVRDYSTYTRSGRVVNPYGRY